MEIKEDRKEQQIKIEDLKGQTKNLEIPYWKKNILLHSKSSWTNKKQEEWFQTKKENDHLIELKNTGTAENRRQENVRTLPIEMTKVVHKI